LFYIIEDKNKTQYLKINSIDIYIKICNIWETKEDQIIPFHRGITTSLKAAALALIVLALLFQTAFSEDWPACKFQCRANDVTVSSLWLGDALGDAILPVESWEEKSCYIWAEIKNNAASPRYAVIVLADLYLNGTFSRTFYDQGLCALESIEAKSTRAYPICPLIWTGSQEVKLSRFVLSWETAKGTDCSQANRKCSNRNTKCYGGLETEYLVQAPLSVSFAYDADCSSKKVSFFGRTEGGLGSYVYDWDFGDGFHSAEKNPIHIYENPGNYTVKLLVRDKSSNGVIASRELTLQSCSCTIAGKDLACLGKVETYRAVMEGLIFGAVHWSIDGAEINSAASQGDGSQGVDGLDINWHDFGPGRHDLQVIVVDRDGSRELNRCNKTINVLPEPEATISLVL
jgi:hypothetical protein